MLDDLANAAAEEDYTEHNDDNNRIDSPDDFGLGDLRGSALHEARQSKYESDRQKLIGKKITKAVVIDRKKINLTWTIIEDSNPESPLREYSHVGIRGIDFVNPSDTIASDTFFKLWPGDCHTQHRNLNHWIDVFNNKSPRWWVKLVMEREWYQQVDLRSLERNSGRAVCSILFLLALTWKG